MIGPEEVASLSREEIPDRACSLQSDDIPLLISLLDEKSDDLRFHSFELLQNRSRTAPDVYSGMNSRPN